MEGLSNPARQIINLLSTLEILNEYQLIGGTALSLQINHRLSEDLDFCRWVPSKDVKYGINAKQIHLELKDKFGEVEINHLDFFQVNFVINDPGVRITFYHTDLRKPNLHPLHLLGNIFIASKEVLGGSKLYVITQRNEIRDYYDVYILLKNDHAKLEDIIEQAQNLSSEANPRSLFRKPSKFNIARFDLDRFEYLNPRYKVEHDQYQQFFNNLALEIQAKYLK